MSTFKPEDFSAWKLYERVRKGGKWNMFDPRARRATGLSGERYSFVMRNYSALRAALEAERAK